MQQELTLTDGCWKVYMMQSWILNRSPYPIRPNPNGHSNTYNFWIWREENPNAIQQVQLYIVTYREVRCSKWVMNYLLQNFTTCCKSCLCDDRHAWQQKGLNSGSFIYVVQSIITWIGLIMALLCITADTWSHKMVSCLFFSRPSKKQLCACLVFRKKVTVVKGSCLQAMEIKNVAVWANAKFC
jgi:hypothetical protein